MRKLIRVSAVCVALAAALCAAPASAITAPFSSTYPASEVRLVRVVGRVEIVVGGPAVSLSITGNPEELEKLQVSTDGAVLKIESKKRRRDIDLDDLNPHDYALIKLEVPQGTKLSIEGMIGEAKIGHVRGDLKVSGTALDAQIGRARTADLSVSGTGKLTIADVEGALAARISGSGKIAAGSADSADLIISGSGDITAREIRHDLAARISGSGDIKAGSANGAVSATIAGSGSLTVERGRADPFTVKITGHGDVSFGGAVVNPDIAVTGAGDVKLGSYTGKLRSRGTSSLTIGN
jgi:hypothetical protein